MQIKDESGDRKYWTQIPNIIVNHSTAYEQSLYLIMKRTAGDEGVCFKSINTLAKNMGVDKKTVSKTIDKLLKRKWIEETEPKKVKGGKVRQFKIIDLWILNTAEYVSGRQIPTHTSGRDIIGSGSIIQSSGRQMDTKNNPKEKLLKKTISSSKKNRPFYRNMPIVWSKGKRWCVPLDNSDWLEFVGKESDIEYR